MASSPAGYSPSLPEPLSPSPQPLGFGKSWRCIALAFSASSGKWFLHSKAISFVKNGHNHCIQLVGRGESSDENSNQTSHHILISVPKLAAVRCGILISRDSEVGSCFYLKGLHAWKINFVKHLASHTGTWLCGCVLSERLLPARAMRIFT